MTHISNLAADIASALNRYSAENESNTPDYILAKFLLGCLASWDNATRERERWYGRNPNEGPVGTISTLGPRESAQPAPEAPARRPTQEAYIARLRESTDRIATRVAASQINHANADALQAGARARPTLCTICFNEGKTEPATVCDFHYRKAVDGEAHAENELAALKANREAGADAAELLAKIADALDCPIRPSGERMGWFYCDHCRQTFPTGEHPVGGPEGDDCVVYEGAQALKALRAALAAPPQPPPSHVHDPEAHFTQIADLVHRREHEMSDALRACRDEKQETTNGE